MAPDARRSDSVACNAFPHLLHIEAVGFDPDAERGDRRRRLEPRTQCEWRGCGRQSAVRFPTVVGQNLEPEYTEQHPNKVFASQKWSSQYRVVGVETVEVPAGKFQAIKVEAEGDWVAQLEPTQTITQAVQTQQGDTAMITHAQKTGPTQLTGRTYKAFWYVPEIGRWVKSVEEYYGSNGVRNERYTAELESYKRSPE